MYRYCSVKVGIIDEIIADAAKKLPILHGNDQFMACGNQYALLALRYASDM